MNYWESFGELILVIVNHIEVYTFITD